MADRAHISKGTVAHTLYPHPFGVLTYRCGAGNSPSLFALRTDGWALVKADPFLSDTHWVPGTFELGKPTPGYYFGPEGQDGRFHVTGQGIPEPPATSTPADRGGRDVRRWGSSEPGHSGTPGAVHLSPRLVPWSPRH